MPYDKKYIRCYGRVFKHGKELRLKLHPDNPEDWPIKLFTMRYIQIGYPDVREDDVFLVEPIKFGHARRLGLMYFTRVARLKQ